MVLSLHHAHCVSAPKNKYINADNTATQLIGYHTEDTRPSLPRALSGEVFVTCVCLCALSHFTGRTAVCYSGEERLIRCSIRADKTVMITHVRHSAQITTTLATAHMRHKKTPHTHTHTHCSLAKTTLHTQKQCSKTAPFKMIQEIKAVSFMLL